MKYTVSIIYKHGTGNILNVLNNSLQDVFLVTLQINLITFFRKLKIFYSMNHLPRKGYHILDVSES